MLKKILFATRSSPICNNAAKLAFELSNKNNSKSCIFRCFDAWWMWLKIWNYLTKDNIQKNLPHNIHNGFLKHKLIIIIVQFKFLLFWSRQKPIDKNILQMIEKLVLDYNK